MLLAFLASLALPGAQPLALEESLSPEQKMHLAADTDSYGQGQPVPGSGMIGLALGEARQGGGPYTLWLTSALNTLAGVFENKGMYEEAEQVLDRALAIDEQMLEASPSYVIRDLHNLANLSYKRGKYDKAGDLIQRTIAIIEPSLGLDHPHVAMSLNDLAIILEAQGRHASAEQAFERSLEIFEAHTKPEKVYLMMILENYASLLRHLDRHQEAEDLETRLKRNFEKQDSDPDGSKD
jgi:tetratricopeptide (TPR) repeat protein